MTSSRHWKQARRAAISPTSPIWAHGVGSAAIALWTAVAAMGLAACEGCRPAGGTTPAPSAQVTSSEAGPPTLRLYLVSDFAGALEPCGCTKDQLGGLDHLAAWTHAEQAKAPVSALVAAGPLFFMEPSLKADHAAQDVAKAETIASSLKALGFAAFAPGANDFSGGAAELAKLRDASGGALVLSNASESDAGAAIAPAPFVVREMNGLKVAFIGALGEDAVKTGPLPLSLGASAPAIKAAFDAAKTQGAQVVVALAAVGRGEAKRIADTVPGLTAIVVGSPGGSGEANTVAPPPERVGDVIIAETGNHLTTVGVLDLYVRDGGTTFADATGLELGRRREELRRRIDELRAKIAVWEKDAKIAKADLDARRAEVAKLEGELGSLDAPKPAPPGSFFRYTVKEVRDALGRDPKVADAMLAYYKQVNDHNKVALASRMPVPHTADQATYIGVNACTNCHKEPREVWDKTAHAHAYVTLSKQFKEFNLDCVSCHVTGYDQPGGSTVTHVDRLTDVQCEVCHGPGSKHAANPKTVSIPTKKPKGELCLSCHHPPHVAEFDAEKKMLDILGPGHGL